MTVAGDLFIISAPSGAGKTSLVTELIRSDPKVRVSISHTTRAKRPGEKEGQNYYFVDRAKFQSMIANEEFLEYAEVFGNYYGTERASLYQQLAEGYDVILEIDWQGARQVMALHPSAVSIFILPPSQAALRERLEKRGQDAPEVIDSRMAGAVAEMSHYDEYQYIIINKDFTRARSELELIFCANRLKSQRQTVKNAQLLHDLLV
jgi:guanylate kinase